MTDVQHDEAAPVEEDDGLRLEDKAEISIRQRLAVLEEWAQRANSGIRALGFALLALIATTALLLLSLRKRNPA
jgi:hypothetical protein